ncbi:hypothetical protein DENIS_1904 [Desulfonema ishimotonii]|uniref:asparagine synthase (glutamine-hydrolyzing) n=1 Tax=Desulfonema ishimotonii TaxID=45657 RepID=A0A401FVH7_9BACT|nr:hypothetical protein [Desulfonema ishimotonii]GBC60944.1 hypothetical protein DENIS_1904 [Desulfonema ishimotonii]
MSLILGCYSFKKEIGKKEIRSVLDDFSLGGERALRTEFRGRLALSVTGSHSDCIAENEDRSLTVLFSGEIYDFEDAVSRLMEMGYTFRDPENCAEFVLNAYAAYGDAFLETVNGIFALAIRDREKEELVLANDPFGLYPLFICHKNDMCIFCTEYEPITRYEKFDRSLDYDAVAEYFTLGMPLGDRTFFKDIRNLSPGSVLRLKQGHCHLRRYDEPDIRIDRDKSITEFAEVIAGSFRRAVQARVKHPENMRCALTGGADTRLILSCLTRAQRQAIVFYTEKSPFLSEEQDRDVRIARMLADRLNLSFEVVNQERYTFGTAYFEETRVRSFEKRLSGICGSQFMGGTCYRYSPIEIAKMGTERHRAIRYRLEKLFEPAILERIQDPYISLFREIGRIRSDNRQLAFSMFQFARGYFTNIFGGTRNAWLDSYRHWTRVSSPFCDTALLKLLLSVPKAYSVRHRLYNLIYKNHFPELLDIPTNSPLARREESCMTYICDGVEPKSVRNPNYTNALRAFLKHPLTWERGMYRSRNMMNLICYGERNAALRFAMKLITRLERKHGPIRSALDLMAARGKSYPRAELFQKHLHSRKGDRRLMDSFTDFEAWYRALVV